MLFYLSSLSAAGAPITVILQVIIGVLLGVLIGMTVHEFAHNYVAYLMGDRTPLEQGRLTLNPMTHIYWPGFIMFALIGFGILGTAPINARRMRNPRWGYLAAVAGGPFSNLLVAIVLGLVFRLVAAIDPSSIFLITLQIMVSMNLILFLFNLIPLFPLDGWHIVYAALPPDLAYKWERTAQYAQMIMWLLILTSFVPIIPPQFNPLTLLVTGPMNFLMRLIIG